MPSSRIAFPLAIALVAVVARTHAQTLEHPGGWAPDPRLSAALVPLASAPSAAELAGGGLEVYTRARRGARHAVASVLAGAMVGTMLGMIESGRPRLHCADVVEGPAVITCPPLESGDRPIVIGAALGAAVGLVYHLLRPDPVAGSERQANAR